jgi:hypothetical protein
MSVNKNPINNKIIPPPISPIFNALFGYMNRNINQIMKRIIINGIELLIYTKSPPRVEAEASHTSFPVWQIKATP